MTQKSLLMLGDDAHVVRACADLDVNLTVLCSYDSKDFGLTVPPNAGREILIEDVSSLESIYQGLWHAGLDLADFDAVYTTDEGAVVTAAILNEQLNLRWLAPGQAGAFRDKARAKTLLQAKGVATAKFAVVDDLHNLPADVALPFSPAVLKPIAGAATYRTVVITDVSELRSAAALARTEGWPRTYLIESFVEGDEWRIDGFVFDGELLFASVATYRQTCLTAVTSKQPVSMYLFDPENDREKYEQALPMAAEALRTLGLKNGVFHLEAFCSSDTGQLVFGECAARRGGGLIEEEILRKFGISLSRAAVQCALGIKPDQEADLQPSVVGTAFLPLRPGVLVDHPELAELGALPNVQLAVIDIPLGFEMESPVSTIMKMGQVLLAADSVSEFLERADSVVDWFHERTVVIPPTATPAELRRWQASVADRLAARYPGHR